MSNKHIHQYVKVKIADRKDAIVWFKCNAIGCTHKIRAEFAENRLSICNRCGNEFVLTREKMKLVRPHCDACTMSTKAKNIKDLAELFKD